MDYGKLAYLKTEDLERMISRLSKKQTDFSGGRVSYEIGRTIENEYNVTDIRCSGGGNVCMIIKFSAESPKKSFLDVLIGGKTAARQIIEQGEREYLVLLQSRILDTATLALNAQDIFVKKLELMIIGGAATYGGRRLAGDAGGGGRAVVIEVIGETISFFEGREDGLNFSAGKSAETVGRAADAVYSDGRFYTLILDLYGNLWLCDYSGGGQYKFLGNSGGDCATLGCSFGGLCAAAVKGGKIIIYDLDSFGDYAEEEQTDIVTGATDIKFAKGSDRPILAAKSNSGSCFVLAEREIRCGETVEVSIRAAVA